MQKTRSGQTVETATEARAGERGPSMLLVLGISVVALGVIYAGLWFFAVI